ncbi:methyltransferase domain-containing protein [Alkalicoccus halolimnae]|uniref:Methyltransferase domain-containing protein n=1 Tax=Alkalicoccus halolimnae TaxID=1667239 RepID=A0A5C7F493_9BACI|nr:methyltransferase domain-containing protein [Alkalicoccus halolimnae]TXF82765.1 methyltransferase domain-containing protein [Alkalicoccus halolimnae]
MRSKREIRADLMKQGSPFLRCPYCCNALNIEEDKRLVCDQGHTFDLAKQGHVHLTKKPASSNYSGALFTAREEVIRGGMYDPLHEILSGLVPHEEARVLDAGCGEGSHLSAVHERKRIFGAGADLAKAGIEQAAKREAELLWFVADLAEAPFQDESFDVIFNIFSPANYQEFRRLVKKGGKVIKVIPGTGYLQEIRELTGEAAYDNKEVIEGFTAQFPEAERQTAVYTFELPEKMRRPLLQMTPLTWKYAGDEKMKEWEEKLRKITVEVEVLIGVV